MGGKKILSESSVAEMQKVQTGQAKPEFSPKVAEGFAWSLGNWIQERDDQGNGILFSCPGLSGGWPFIDKQGKYACVIFVSNKDKEEKKEPYLEIIEAVKGTRF